MLTPKQEQPFFLYVDSVVKEQISPGTIALQKAASPNKLVGQVHWNLLTFANQ